MVVTRDRVRGAALTGLLVLMVAALVGCAQGGAGHRVVIGSAGDPGMRVMAEIYAGVLRSNGADVSVDRVTADDRTLLDRMDRTEIDLFPAFTGDLLAELTPTSTAVGADQVFDDVNRALPKGVSVGDQTPVSAAPQVFVASALAESAGVTDLVDCGRLPANLPVIVTEQPEPATLRALAGVGCRFGPVQVVGAVDAALTRVAAGDALGLLTPLDVASTESSGPTDRVQALRVPKADERETAPAGAKPAAPESTGPRAQVLVPVFRTAALSRDQVKALNKVAGEITTADLATMARRVETGADPRELAVNWLAEHGL